MSGSGARVLVVDDERAIQRALKATLEAAGYHVDIVGTCADALAQVALKPPDLVLLDLLLPDGTGDEVAREIRTWSNVPILLVSAVGDEREKVKALDAGADDYVTKPFGIDELLARVRAMLRRAVDRPRPDAVVELGELRVDLARRRVTRDGDEIHLTPIEYDLLRTLVAHPGKVLTHKAIIQEVWGPGYGESHLLRVHIAALRRKIERDPRNPELIETVTGVGYRIREPEPRECRSPPCRLLDTPARRLDTALSRPCQDAGMGSSTMLGPEHPLARADSRLRTLRAQLAVTVVFGFVASLALAAARSARAASRRSARAVVAGVLALARVRRPRAPARARLRAHRERPRGAAAAGRGERAQPPAATAATATGWRARST